MVRASRVRNLGVTGELFTRAMRGDPLAAPDYSQSYRLQTVVLRVADQHAFRVFDEFPEQDVAQQADGSFLVRQDMPINEWLIGYLLSFGDGIEVLEPAGLRAALGAKICAMFAKYDILLSGSEATVPLAKVMEADIPSTEPHKEGT